MKYLIMLHKVVVQAGLILFAIGMSVISIEKLYDKFDLASMPTIGTIVTVLIGWGVGSALGPIYTAVERYYHVDYR